MSRAPARAAGPDDDGKTWVKGFQQIEARRIGRPRSLGPLAPGRNVDPISGTWMHDSGAGLELVYDGKGGVTGRLLIAGRDAALNPAIRAGTFDPRTGGLRLDGEDRQSDGTKVPFVVDGKLEQGILTVHYTVGTESGSLKFTRKPR